MSQRKSKLRPMGVDTSESENEEEGEDIEVFED